MSAYVRFTPAEYRALCQVCVAIDFRNDLFRIFKQFLVESLKDSSPALAGRVAQLSRAQVRVVYQYLKEQRQDRAEARRLPPPPPPELSPTEFQAVTDVADAYRLPAGFPHVFRDFLARQLRELAPDLVRKLT